MTMTKTDRDALRALEATLTPGPWCIHPNGTSVWTGAEYDSDNYDQHMVASTGVAQEPAAQVDNAAFIAWCREGVPALCDEVERLRAENAKLNEQRLAALGLGELEREALEVVRAENVRLADRVRALSEALRWYADEANYDEEGAPGEWESGVRRDEAGFDCDNGERARAALKGGES